jgi:hypothetical protein
VKIGEIVSFRRDLLFNGAVQISWLEVDPDQAEQAARHFIFHGPKYHGAAEADFGEGTHKLVDTASFTLDILHRVSGKIADEPFSLAIAGYGTGKSHLGVTLACLLSNPGSRVAKKILENISIADQAIGSEANKILSATNQPYLVVALNGMQDFDLTAEIVRQILLVLNRHGLDTSVLENLRPRFKSAINFTESFFGALRDDFEQVFGKTTSQHLIIEKLSYQDEEIFCRVNEIYQQKMGSSIRAVGQESLHDFIRITKETFCGQGKFFAGIVIIFDEFGRYLEFAVQKPHIAGSGALQQLFESVQAHGDKVFLLSFIQYELKAYISRIAPELRDDLDRYVTRFDAVRKVRLSTNLETLISSLLEKKNLGELECQVAAAKKPSSAVQSLMHRWFPDIKNHSLWLDTDRFDRTITRGCWPLHPISTWVLHRLSSAGKSLQQRSALSLLADVINDFQNQDVTTGAAIAPVELCNQSLINEFLASERYGQQGAAAYALEAVFNKYQYELTSYEKLVLKAVLLSSKIGVKVIGKEEYLQVLTSFTGMEAELVGNAVHSLEFDYAVLAWNERLRQFEIIEDAVPRSKFMAQLAAKAAQIDTKKRSEIFTQKYKSWRQLDTYATDFGPINKISTREWNYKVSFASVHMLKGQVDFALRSWHDARGVDEEKGQLIYCYVGPDSNFQAVKEMATSIVRDSLKQNGLNLDPGAPVAIIFLNDQGGHFGQKIAEYWVLQEHMSEAEIQQFGSFILHVKNNVEQEMANLFLEMEKERHILYATEKEIKDSRIKNMLTDLFDVVYHKRISFPFDGFSTVRGNAAKDCQVFIRELFLGTLDREWLAARSVQQRNRAYLVLDETWGVIAEDGSIRLRPVNLAVREIVDFLETELSNQEGTAAPVNLGRLMRTLCLPPFGCNIASAGLILALFTGKRRNEINMLRKQQPVSIENWLQDAMPGNFLDLSVLDASELVRVSREALSEWEVMLENLEQEPTLLGKVEYLRKAGGLEQRIPVPQILYHRYQRQKEKAQQASRRLAGYSQQLEEALSKVESGKEQDDAGKLSWGAAELFDLNSMIIREGESWTKEQREEIERHLAEARIQTKQRFDKWVRRQTVSNIERLMGFIIHLRNKVGNNLIKLGLMEEQKLLEEQVNKVEEHVRHIEQIKAIVSDIGRVVQKNLVTTTVPLSVLQSWLEQAKVFDGRLNEARNRTDLVQSDVERAAKVLFDFQQQCRDQILKHQDRMAKIYNIEDCSSLVEIARWRQEVTLLLAVYEGQERNVEDLALVQKQIDLIEKHFRELANQEIDNAEFARLCCKCHEETMVEFADDQPPLDYETIYEKMINTALTKREKAASEWIEQNVPSLATISKFDAPASVACKNLLQKMPPVLSAEQKRSVSEAIHCCERRLDELEVEGLFVRFQAMSENGKSTFLKRIHKFILNFYEDRGRSLG